MDWKRELETLGFALNHGNVAVARRGLRELIRREGRRVPRARLTTLAGLARRAELCDLSLQLLRPYVHPERVRANQATPLELSEYAAALVFSGAVSEALQLLGRIDRGAAPSSHLYEAFAHIYRWDHPAAIRALGRWRRDGKQDPFRELAFHLHMGTACAYVPGRLGEARGHLERVLAETTPERFRYLHEKAHSRLIEVCFYEARYGEALALIARVERTSELRSYFENDRAHLALFAALCRVGKARTPSRAELRTLERARERVWASDDPLHAREGDIAAATVTGSRELLLHCRFGTRFSGLRAELDKKLRATGTIPAEWIWNPSRLRMTEVLDSRSGRFGAQPAELPRGMQLQRLLEALASDFYQFFRPAELLEILAPGELYHPEHSRNRTQQLVHRFRTWARSAGVPVEIRERAGGYRLFPGTGVGVRVYADPGPDRPGEGLSPRVRAEVGRLREHFGAKTFGAREAAAAIGADQRTVTRTLTPALKAGLLVREGGGPATRYRLLP